MAAGRSLRMRPLLALALVAAVALVPGAAAEPVAASLAASSADCRGPIDTNCYDENSRDPFCYLYVVVLCIPDPI